MSIRKPIIVLALLAISGVAAAHTCERGGEGCGGQPVAAPEIDPASAISGLSLLLGGVAVIRGRRRKP